MIKIYTDGSCIGNPGNGGWAAIIIKDEKKTALDSLGSEFEKYFKNDNDVLKFNYQIDKLIDSVKSNSLKKSDNIEGKLIGVKGQYLIFDDSSVFNVRSNEGYVVDITISD